MSPLKVAVVCPDGYTALHRNVVSMFCLEQDGELHLYEIKDAKRVHFAYMPGSFESVAVFVQEDD
mgnify:CR=1 FL=1